MFSVVNKYWILVFVGFFVFSSVENTSAFVAKEAYDCNAPENKNNPTKIDLKLAKKPWRKKKREIKKEILAENGNLKVRLTFFPFLNPPTNLGIGKCVSADHARLTIKKALKYNRGIDQVIMQEFMPHHWARVGATDLAELTFIKITPEDLTHLSDPSLSTEQFQKLYLELSRLKERILPFGMGTRKIEPELP